MLRALAITGVLAATVSACAVAARDSEAADTRSLRAHEPSWYVLGRYSTTVKPEELERNANIDLGTRRVDGSVIPPGKRWSFNQRVGERSFERGYRAAPTLTIEGKRAAVGGGICLVSSVVFNAVLLADLAIIQRAPHSRPIPYVPLGRDATVSFGHHDLVVENGHPFPVRLRAWMDGSRITVEVLGTARLAHEIALETADEEPASLRREIQALPTGDDKIRIGGVWVRLYRHRKRHGSVVATERIGTSSYYPFRIVPRDERRSP